MEAFTPMFARDALRLDLVLKRDESTLVSYDLGRRDGWLVTRGTPKGLRSTGKGPAEEADFGRGCGLGPHESLCLDHHQKQMVVRSENGEILGVVPDNEASERHSFSFPTQQLLLYRGDCYLLGYESGACMNRKSGKGDRCVSYKWSTSDGRPLPVDLEVDWGGVLVGCRLPAQRKADESAVVKDS